MLELLRSPVGQAIVLVTFVLMATATAWMLLQSYRNSADDDISTSDQLSLFREMRQRGQLNETEFRSIKSTLGAKLRDELKSSDHQE